MKLNKHIEIVSSTERTLSSMSAKSRQAVFDVLSRHYSDVRITIVNNLIDLEALVVRQPDLVFLGMKFIPTNPSLGLRSSDRIWISEYLDEQNIAYTGSNKFAQELESNKPLAKQRALEAGLKTSVFYVISQDQLHVVENIPIEFPVFIKPTDRGGGEGIDINSVAYTPSQLQTKVQSLSADLNSDSLIERYLPGREFSVAILKNEHSDTFSAMPIEKIPPLDKNGRRLLTQHIKSADSVRDTAVTDKIIRSKITNLALAIFHALGARDYGRIDIRLDELDVPHFLEANLLPSIIEGYGSFPKACLLDIGLEYEPMIISIVRLGLARNIRDTREVLGPIPISKTTIFSSSTEVPELV